MSEHLRPEGESMAEGRERGNQRVEEMLPPGVLAMLKRGAGVNADLLK